MSYKAILPAAGEGRRLKPHTVATPKVLLQVAGKPIIGHILDRLLPTEPEEVIVIVGAQGDQVRAYLESSYLCRFRFVRQDDPRGLGDAVNRASPFFRPGDSVLIVLGDTIVDTDIREMVGGESMLAVHPVSDPRRFGIVETDGKRVTRLIEKPDVPVSNLAIVGVYYLHDASQLFDAIGRLIAGQRRTKGEYQLTDALQLMLEAGATMWTKTVEHWLDCGTREALIATNRHLLQRVSQYRPRPGTVFIPPVFVHDSAIVENSVVGPHVSIGAEAEIRGSVISDSIINDRVIVEHSLLSASILGESSIVRDTPRRLNLGGFSELELG